MHRVKSISPVEAVASLKEARVLQSEQFAKGGNLLVVPFSAGAGVTANDDSDRLSLLIVKGIADVLGDSQHFKLLSAEDAQMADVVIKGRIIQAEQKNTFSKPWGKKPKYLELSVEGSVLGVENEDLIAKFGQVKEIQGKGVNLEKLAYDIGTEIGNFLISEPGP